MKATQAHSFENMSASFKLPNENLELSSPLKKLLRYDPLIECQRMKLRCRNVLWTFVHVLSKLIVELIVESDSEAFLCYIKSKGERDTFIAVNSMGKTLQSLWLQDKTFAFGFHKLAALHNFATNLFWHNPEKNISSWNKTSKTASLQQKRI